MLNYQKVLLATDFSKDSAKVAKRAWEIIKRSGGQLSIVHVLEHTPMIYGGGEFALPLDIDLEATLKDHAEKALEKFCQKNSLIESKKYIVEGSVKRSVIELADQLKTDLIVVGSHGHHGCGLFCGGNAQGILHHAHCDVLIVKL